MGTSRLARRLLVLLPVIGCVLFAGVTMVAGAPTSAFELVFDGRHVPATIPTLSGVMHVACVCRLGSVLRLGNGRGHRIQRIECGDSLLHLLRPERQHDDACDAF